MMNININRQNRVVVMSFTRRKYIVIIVIFFSLLLFTACNSVSFISLNVKVPARIAFPGNINNVVIVNNAGFQLPTEGNTVSMDGEKDTFSLLVDSLSMYACRSLWSSINSQHFFSGVDFYNIQLKDDYSVLKPLNPQKVDEIIALTQADALISLDYYRQDRFLSVKSVTASFDVTSQIMLGVYVPGENRKAVSLRDTIFWEAYGINTTEAIAGIPYLDDAVITAAERTGEIAMRALIPHVQIEDRKYYTSSKGALKKADQAIKADNWGAALDIWKNLYNETTDLGTRAKCAANIALVYEIQNDFAQAEEWAVQARKEFYASGSKSDLNEALDLNYYINRLSRRKTESNLLDVQE